MKERNRYYENEHLKCYSDKSSDEVFIERESLLSNCMICGCCDGTIMTPLVCINKNDNILYFINNSKLKN